MDGSGVYEMIMVAAQKKSTARLVREFEGRGIEYTKGFLAGIQGRKPIWFLKFLRSIRCSLGPPDAEEAAFIMLSSHNIDPLLCGNNFFAITKPS